MNRAVSNTSPLVGLAAIDLLGLVHEQIGQVLIPEAVLEEFNLNRERPATAALRRALEAGMAGGA